MPIQLRLAIAFGLAAAALFVLGGWLFASGLSSAQLKTIASQLALGTLISTRSRGTISRMIAAKLAGTGSYFPGNEIPSGRGQLNHVAVWGCHSGGKE